MGNIEWQLTKSAAIGNEFIDSSTEIFKSGKWAFLAREVIQNSLDALNKENDKLVMNMQLDDVDINKLPNRENIEKHIMGTLNIPELPDRCKSFCNHAKEILNQKNIRILKISDYNTKGVTGSEKMPGEIDSAWNALVYDEGNSQKQDENSTGSFGTGKNAPFALSNINTVFYVTKDINGVYAAEGVSKLFTSYINNEKIERKIYFGKKDLDGKLRPLDYDDSTHYLNDLFWRKECGSDVIIFGVDYDKQKMKKEIIQSVVENFFVLIYDGKLEITIFDQVISKDNIWKIIDIYCDETIEYNNTNLKYGNIRQYMNTYTGIVENKEYNEDVQGAGKLRLIISKGDNISGKWVAMFRNTGMKIFDYNIRSAQQYFSAIFFPGDEDVDKFLRKIENPTHDYFDPEIRIQETTEKANAVKRYNQIKNWIKKCVEDYTKINITENDYLDGMEEYIQLDDSENISKVVTQPEVEVVQIETKNSNSLMLKGDTKKGKTEIPEFKPDDYKSKTKRKELATSTNEEGNEDKGLIKDYLNNFKVYPKITTKENKVKIAFSLEESSEDNINAEITSVGEDNTISTDIPKIVEAIDLNSGVRLKVENNEIKEIPYNSTNLIEIVFSRKFESKYKINIYKVRGEKNED